MDIKQVSGLPVVSIAEAERLGTIDHVLLDLESYRVVGFAVDTSGQSKLARQAKATVLGQVDGDPDSSGMIQAEDVHSLGSDALTVDEKAVLRMAAPEPEGTDVITADTLMKRKVVTEDGTYVGQVVTLTVDPEELRLAHMTVSSGFFEANTDVSAGQISTVGPELIVVADEVCAPAEAEIAPATEGGHESRYLSVEDGAAVTKDAQS